MHMHGWSLIVSLLVKALIYEISNNKYRIRKHIYRVYTLHQLHSNEQLIPEHDTVITFGYDQYYIKKEK